MTGKYDIDKHKLNLKMMLEGGQSFRWKEVGKSSWRGTVAGMVWTLIQTDTCLQYQLHNPPEALEQDFSPQNFLSDYLRLNDPLDDYYNEWGRRDPNFEKVAQTCFGIRMLKQEPLENIFSFICSSNNNIKRISGLVEKLCEMYGKEICEVDGVKYYSFPRLPGLCSSSEGELRGAGFGYRARYISNAAKEIQKLGGEEWFASLLSAPYPETKAQLMKLSGIGPKVADCICLMSLGKMEAVPVDTHVHQIAAEVYLPHLKAAKQKTLSHASYNQIADFFRNLYGPLAGWAHTILFCGDLKAFKELGSEDVIKPKEKKSAKKLPATTPPSHHHKGKRVVKPSHI